ncbi:MULTISPECIES: electron transport complex subunit RsxC [Thiorhodovibrio]|uniref:electron transport complex subunit RsxC n=1 Tax=Thiorhodovibrio TaxID=61593 RepID=UPI0019146FD1|nr:MULTISPECIES: electron transport complex subunit RsxC [Thiorhodovibrio]MBK5967779.1 electron transport complex subunit RsxC [Thiorhodovibrio winogradskyi]WPL14416.1 Nitrogen fixation protein RnfC [Thiorhodovibrio litoralis]
MRLFRIRGGVHPQDRKSLSAERPIEPLPLPQLLHIPLQQHIGAAANPIVERRQQVAKGELIARAQGPVSAPIHAPTSGRIAGIGLYPANHPSGLSVRTISLQPDGEDRWAAGSEELVGVADPFALEPEEIAKRVAAAGVVGMGGATFPAAVKLNLRNRYDLHTLVINGAECEPYLTCDDRLMREQAAAIVDGARIMAHALGVERIIIAIEKNKPQAQQAMLSAASSHDRGQAGDQIGGKIDGRPGERAKIEIVGLPMHYPMGSEKHLVQTLTGLETPARGLTADIGVVVHNPATAFAVHQALREGRPLIDRVVTITGGAIKEPRNLRVLIGTRIETLLEASSGFAEAPARLVSGGPMMGQVIPSARAPVIKGTNGILALTEAETRTREPAACIRCGKCVEVCPCGLVPLDMAAFVRAGQPKGAVDRGLLDCISCGCCAYVCPAHLPLVQYFAHAKGAMAERDRIKQKQTETKRLAEQRTARMEAIKQAKRAAMAKRKQADKAKSAASNPSPAD